MEKVSTPVNLNWIDEALAKEVVDELEAACCLTDGQVEVYKSSKVTRMFVEHQLNPKVRATYEAISTWGLVRCPLVLFFDKALEQNLLNLRWFTLVHKYAEWLSNAPEDKCNEFHAAYPNISKKMTDVFNSPRLPFRVEYNHPPDDITRLTVTYSFEQVQQLVEEAELGRFFLFGKVRHANGTETFTSLTTAEASAIRNNDSNETNVIRRGFFANLRQLWVRKNDADELLKMLKGEAGQSRSDKESCSDASVRNTAKQDLKLPEAEILELTPKRRFKWQDVARRLANRLALRKWREDGIEEITARNICNEVAMILKKHPEYWGRRGPRCVFRPKMNAYSGTS